MGRMSRQLGDMVHPKANLHYVKMCLEAARRSLIINNQRRGVCVKFDVSMLDDEEIQILMAGLGEYDLRREGARVFAVLKGKIKVEDAVMVGDGNL